MTIGDLIGIKPTEGLRSADEINLIVTRMAAMLPEEYRKAYTHNCLSDMEWFNYNFAHILVKDSSMLEFIIIVAAFSWSSSREGLPFWRDLQIKIRKGEIKLNRQALHVQEVSRKISL